MYVWSYIYICTYDLIEIYVYVMIEHGRRRRRRAITIDPPISTPATAGEPPTHRSSHEDIGASTSSLLATIDLLESTLVAQNHATGSTGKCKRSRDPLGLDFQYNTICLSMFNANHVASLTAWQTIVYRVFDPTDKGCISVWITQPNRCILRLKNWAAASEPPLGVTRIKRALMDIPSPASWCLDIWWFWASVLCFFTWLS